MKKDEKKAPIIDLTMQATSELQENVFANMPEHGTVVATLNSVELDKINELSDTLASFELAPRNGDNMEKLIRTRQNLRGAWSAIYVKYGVNSGWPVTLDNLSGVLYIDNK